MKQYKPIACYDSAEDILALFPCDRPKPDMGDIIYNRYKEGFGEPRKIDTGDDPFSFWTEEEIEEDKRNFILTADKLHGVRFTRGRMMASGVPMGYYIDIYELIQEPEEELKPKYVLDCDTHLLCESIQEVTLYAWPKVWDNNKYDQDSRDVLETLREWGVEFENYWQAQLDKEEYYCDTHDYREELLAFTEKKCQEYLEQFK